MRDGQMPVMSDGHEAKAEAQNASGQSGCATGKTKHIADDNDGGTSQRCNGIKIRAQHLRDLRKEHVAHHAAADAGQHAQKR